MIPSTPTKAHSHYDRQATLQLRSKYPSDQIRSCFVALSCETRLGCTVLSSSPVMTQNYCEMLRLLQSSARLLSDKSTSRSCSCLASSWFLVWRALLGAAFELWVYDTAYTRFMVSNIWDSGFSLTTCGTCTWKTLVSINEVRTFVQWWNNASLILTLR